MRLVLPQVILDWYEQYTYQYHIPRLLPIYQYKTGYDCDHAGHVCFDLDGTDKTVPIKV